MIIQSAEPFELLFHKNRIANGEYIHSDEDPHDSYEDRIKMVKSYLNKSIKLDAKTGTVAFLDTGLVVDNYVYKP